MALHIIKLAVGVRDVAHLVELQKSRLQREGVLAHITRNTPRRAGLILDGGSIYWVIKKFVRVRQLIIGIERGVNGDGKPSCALLLDTRLVPTELKEFRAFQGWRYFPEEAVPADLNRTGKAAGGPLSLPDDMAAELKSLGLI